MRPSAVSLNLAIIARRCRDKKAGKIRDIHDLSYRKAPGFSQLTTFVLRVSQNLQNLSFIGPRLDAPTLPTYISGKVPKKKISTMFVKITAKRQVTFPARVLEALGVKPGDRIELVEGPEGFVLRARHIDRARLAPLRGKLRRGKGTFDLEAFRSTPHDRTLRD